MGLLMHLVGQGVKLTQNKVRLTCQKDLAHKSQKQDSMEYKVNSIISTH